MEIKAGNRKLLLPYDDDLSYWSQVKHRTAAFLFVHDNGNDFVVCCRCGYTRRTKRYCSDNIECPNCGNFHRWNSGKTYVEYSLQNILVSSPKIITQNGEKNVRILLYRFRGENNCRPRKLCELLYSRSEGVRFENVQDGETAGIQEIRWNFAKMEEPIVQRIIRAFETVYPSSGISELLQEEQKIGYSFDFKALLNYFQYLPQYPYLEQLAKSGYGRVLADILRRSPALIKRKLGKLFTASTKEKEITKLPSYIREYIKQAKRMDSKRMAILSELYSLEPDMTRETFELFKKAFPHYIQAMSLIRRMIKECGYSLAEVCRLVLGSRDTSYPRKALWLQLDYINMCRQMEIPFERFPKYVKKAHDDVSAKFEVKKNEYLIRAFAKKVEELREVRMENGRYQIRCPKSLEELILEGQRMHHCVASYAQRFSNGSSLIFFMRKTEEPDESYITMEFDCAGRLLQARKAFNRGIQNSEESRLIQKFQREVLAPALKRAA